MPASSFLAALLGAGGGGGGGQTVGQVATRSYIPTTLSTASQNYINSRTAHVATQALTSLQVIFPAWYSPVNNGAETAATVAPTYTATIEYPQGTLNRVTWGGNGSVTATIGSDTGLSDVIALSTPIPAGATFWVKNFCTAGGSSGGLVSTTPGFTTVWTAAGEACQVSSTSISDQTGVSTPFADGGTNVIVYPLAIVANTVNPAIMVIGDSRSQGAGMTPDANGCQGQITPSLGTSIAWIDTAVYGSFLYAFNRGASTQRQKLAAYCTHAVNGYGINDIRSGGGNRTAAQVEGDTRTLTQQILLPIAGATLMPVTSSTDGWSTTANQTADSNNAARLTFNTWIQGLPDVYSYVGDVSTPVSDATLTNVWKVGDTSDGIHNSAAGSTGIIAANTWPLATLKGMTRANKYSILKASPNVYWLDLSNAAHVDGHCGGSNGIYTVSGAPAVSPTAFNGGPGTVLNGTTQYYFGGTALLNLSNNSTGFSFCALFTFNAIPTGLPFVIGLTTGSSTTVRACILINNSGIPSVAFRRLDAEATSSITGPSALVVGTTYLMVATFDPVNSIVNFFINGVLIGTKPFLSSGNFPATASAVMSLSAWNSGYLSATWAEGIVLDSVMSTSTQQKVEGFAAWRHGVASLVLPANHPYYNAPPLSN